MDLDVDFVEPGYVRSPSQALLREWLDEEQGSARHTALRRGRPATEGLNDGKPPLTRSRALPAL